MRRRALERLLDDLVEAVPRGIREAYIKENACILATRLGVEALRSRGVRARPLPVKLSVMNAAYARLVEQDEPNIEKWKAAGAWSVLVGHGSDRPGGWNGHLVIIADERYLLDLTAHQVRRLKQRIAAKAFWFPAPNLVRGKREGLLMEDSAVWVYEPTGNRSFLQAPAWSAYRITVRPGQIVSERTRLRPDVPVAPKVTVNLKERAIDGR